MGESQMATISLFNKPSSAKSKISACYNFYCSKSLGKYNQIIDIRNFRHLMTKMGNTFKEWNNNYNQINLTLRAVCAY